MYNMYYRIILYNTACIIWAVQSTKYKVSTGGSAPVYVMCRATIVPSAGQQLQLGDEEQIDERLARRAHE